jgi:hypothetical protein
MNTRALPLFCAGALALAASAGADVEITRRWAAAAPVVDGVVSAGEWSAAQVTPLAHGQMRTMNDSTHLYVLLDVTGDTVNDPTSGPGPADYFVLAFDIDRNFAVSPNVDLFYDACQDSRSFVKAYYLGGSTSTGCRDTDPASAGVPGFGPSPASAANHRIWEFRLVFSEIGVDPTTWTTSSGDVPSVRVNVATISANPAFSSAEPDPSPFAHFANPVFQVDLASFPLYPPGSTGPTFYGVGLVPSTYIDSLGYANLNVPGYPYTATAAPFGGNLNVFGRSFLLTGAARYRVMVSKDGGPAQPLLQTWTNFRFNSGTGNWDPVAVAPDSNGRYPSPNPFQLWYLPNLIMSWQTSGFGDGTYVLSLELYNLGGTLLPAPAGNSLTLFVTNTPPVPVINGIAYDGVDACACAIVTQGSAPRGFTFDISFTDPHGALASVSLGGIFGQNQSTGSIYSDSYSAHVDEDGTHRWNGETNVVVPGTPFRASTSCAYSFILTTASRTQNGYSRLFPAVQYHTSLTILRGSGAGSIDGCSGGSLAGRLSLNATTDSGPAWPRLGGSLSRLEAVAAPAAESGRPAGLP